MHKEKIDFDEVKNIPISTMSNMYYSSYYNFIDRIIWFYKSLERVKDKKIKHKLVLWFWFRPKKYKIYNEWLMKGVSTNLAFNKAKNDVPYFNTTKEKDRWIRQQKFKKILKYK